MILHRLSTLVPATLLYIFTLMELSLAYPSLVMPRLHTSADKEVGIMNKNMGFPQTDDDVLQLEQLREIHDDDVATTFSHHKKSDVMEAEVPQPLVKDEPTLPELEQQLESATPQLQSTHPPPQTGAARAAEASEISSASSSGGEQNKMSGGHRPPTLQSNDGGKAESTGEKPKAKCRLNGMHGAARLVYGQNPEVLPTTTAASTTLKSTTTTAGPPSSPSTAEQSPSKEDSESDAEAPLDSDISEDAKQETIVFPDVEANGENQQPSEVEVTQAAEVPPTTVATQPTPPLRPYKPVKATKKPNREEEPERQLIGDVIIDESALHKSTSRRSVAPMTPKTAESLLRHGNGQYSSFDMAQYVFWTGDESGVAKAVEELIQQDLMTREDALKFLHEIRVGIEYLRKSYANRIFPEEIRHNTVKKSFMLQPLSTDLTTITTMTTTTPKPALTYINNEQNLEDTSNINLAKTLDSIALLHKLQALNNQGRQDNSEYDNEILRRPKITDCDHKEYNLEEIIYKLARIMFTETLTHGDEAQREIQKLMDFFEREHELGVIPLDLEQKVIHVLIQALSDTLTEKPELWPAAQYPYNRLLRTYAYTTNYMRPTTTNV